jgi:phage shock protein PspC (stress-responsive transcriptional regulator)
MDQAAEPQRQPQAGAPPAGAATPARGRLVRRTDNRLLAGVAGGIADALGIHPVLVRIAFVVPTAFGGLGAWLYVLGWLLLPPHRPRRVKLAVLWVLALVWAAALAGYLEDPIALSRLSAGTSGRPRGSGPWRPWLPSPWGPARSSATGGAGQPPCSLGWSSSGWAA